MSESPVVVGAILSLLLELVDDLADLDPCSFDHHGNCQAHGWTRSDRQCPHRRAQALLVFAEDTGLPVGL